MYCLLRVYYSFFNRLNRYIIRFKFRNVCCEFNSIVIGPDIDRDFDIICPQKLCISAGTVINGRCYINASGGVAIGRYCHIGKGLTIFSSNHNYNSVKAIPYDEMDILKPVIIEDFVWCGANVTIIPGIVVGEGAVIGAGAVVSKSVPRGAIVGGNPAQVIKYRDMIVFEKLKAEGKFH